MKILSVVGTRPNFIKIAPILRALRRVNEDSRSGQRTASILVHTEQHYDDTMSARVFADLQMPAPDYTLGVGSASHAVQTAEIMRRVEPVLIEARPDVVLVVGDLNSTAACALTAAKLHIPVAHVEAGLRSFDRTMPEEINRIVTDALSRFLFITEASAGDNLHREGHAEDAIFFVGNVMVDSLDWCRASADTSTIVERWRLPRKTDGGFALLTLHRPSNVDARSPLERVLRTLAEVAHSIPVIFPAHPRTRARIQEYGLDALLEPLDVHRGPRAGGRITLLEPAGYVDFFRIMSEARVVLTDSGGIQDETTWLGIPCLTLRENTERPVTITAGTSRLVGNDPERIRAAVNAVLNNGIRPSQRPPLWDGHAAERVVQALVEHL